MDELILETNERWERIKSIWGYFTFSGAPGVHLSNSLLAWGDDNMKKQEKLQAKLSLLMMLLLHCIPYYVHLKYVLTFNSRYYDIGSRVETLCIYFPVWIWIYRKLVGFVYLFVLTLFFDLFFICFFWYLLCRQPESIQWPNHRGHCPPTCGPQNRKKGTLIGVKKLSCYVTFCQFSLQSESWDFSG